MERTYVGPLPRGVVTFPDDSTVAFTRGIPVEITPDQAKALSEDPDWTTPKAKAAKVAPVPTSEED